MFIEYGTFALWLLGAAFLGLIAGMQMMRPVEIKLGEAQERSGRLAEELRQTKQEMQRKEDEYESRISHLRERGVLSARSYQDVLDDFYFDKRNAARQNADDENEWCEPESKSPVRDYS